ncbi:MarR family transcriptional regulator [beta proteobacterium AAP99]|nr:MarR family transcriptional regulator [beta proteobacterium AAP99]
MAERAARLRAFNRFYTQRIGATRQDYLDSPYTLAEMRILYELAHRDGATLSSLSYELGLDAGYLSRTLKRFTQQGLVAKWQSKADHRQMLLTLTKAGREAFAPFDARSQQQAESLLAALPEDGQAELIAHLAQAEALLTGSESDVTMRSHQPGDMGWVIEAHARLYAQEYGWNGEFELMVAEICTHFLKHFDPSRERCWIVERAGQRLGCAFVVQKSKTVAQLRCVLLEPAARGIGLGKRLVSEAIDFARASGYREMMLWTNDCLHAARAVYEQAGFTLRSEEQHESFGVKLVGQEWMLKLDGRK